MFKKVKDFMLSTLLGGVLVLVPLALLVYLVNELFRLVISATDPIAQLLPEQSVWRAPLVVELLLLTALVAIAFVSGLVLRASVRSRAGAWLEKVILRNIPGYQVLKTMTRGLSDGEGAKGSRAALIVSPDGYRQLGVVVEDRGGERSPCFSPRRPPVWWASWGAWGVTGLNSSRPGLPTPRGCSPTGASVYRNWPNGHNRRPELGHDAELPWVTASGTSASRP